MDLGGRIRERRELLKMSQDDLAAKMGYKSRSTIAKIESGENDITQSKIAMMAKLLDTTPAYLMGWDDAKIMSAKKTRNIPLVGTIAAGAPLYAEQYIEMEISIPEDLNVDFALRVRGDSMIGAGIHDGSIVLCRRQEDVDDGQIAVVTIDGEDATLKRIKRYDSLLVLHPENPEMKDIVIKGRERGLVRIMGRAVYVIYELQ